MECPKCRKKMESYCGFSAPSQLARMDGSAAAAMVHGFKCWNCGKWFDAEVVPMQLPEEEAKPQYNPEVRVQAFYVVERFFDSIAMQRSRGASWYCVAKLMNQAGFKCQEKTLQKYFLLEQERRCRDEAQKT